MRVRVGEVANEIVDLVEGTVALVERLVRGRRNRIPTLPAALGSHRRAVCERGSPAVNGVVADDALSGQESELCCSLAGVWKVDIDVRMAYLPEIPIT